MTQEALKLALDFVETVHVGEWVGSIERQLEVITAVKKALAQPVQEPVAWQFMNGSHFRKRRPDDFADLDSDGLPYWKPLYTAPPQRSESSGKPSAWVGLTDKQTTQAIKSMPRGIKGLMIDWDLYDFSKAIEAKLKEKNT